MSDYPQTQQEAHRRRRSNRAWLSGKRARDRAYARGKRATDRETDPVVYEATIRLVADREIAPTWLAQHLRLSVPGVTGTVWRGALAGAGAAGNLIAATITEVTRGRSPQVPSRDAPQSRRDHEGAR